MYKILREEQWHNMTSIEDIDRKIYHQIAKRLPKSWKQFAQLLGLETCDINSIDIDEHNCYDKTYKCFETKLGGSTEKLNWKYWKSVLFQLDGEGKDAVDVIENKFPSLLQCSNDELKVVHESFADNGGCAVFMHDAGKEDDFTLHSLNHEKKIAVNFGAGGKKLITYKKLADLSKLDEIYFNNYPTLKTTTTYDLSRAAVNKKCSILWSLDRWLYLNNDIGFLIKGYDVKNHFDLFTKDRMDNQTNAESCITLYSEKQKAILHIEIVTDSILVSIVNNNQKIKLFRSLHISSINKGIVHIPVVLYDTNVHAGQIETICKECITLQLVVPCSTFEDQRKIGKWWDDINHTIEGMKDTLKKTSTKGVSSSLRSSIISFMALADFNLPSYATFSKYQSQELTKLIMVSPEQQAIRYSHHKRIIIKGCYGSGKSVASQLRIQILLNTIKANECMYHICHDPNSSFIEEMETFANSLGLLKKLIVCSSYDLVKNDNKLSSILKALLHKHPGKVIHVVVEEFDGESIDDNEVEQLKTTLSSFNDSHVVLVAQSMESQRFRIISNSNRVAYEKYQYQQLTKEANFQIFCLSHCIRLSKSIDALVNTAILQLEQVKIQSKIPKLKKINSNDDQIMKTECDNSDDLSVITDFSLETNTAELEKGIEQKISEPVLLVTNVLHDHLQTNSFETNEKSANYVDDSSSLTGISKVSYESDEINQNDALYENKETNNKAVDAAVILKYCTQNLTMENSLAIESKYGYVRYGEIAHDIKGIFPKIYYPFTNDNEEYTYCYKKQIYCLTLLLKNIIEVKEKYVVLCFNNESFNYLHDALANSYQIPWTTSTSCFNQENYQLLITHYTSIKGCEFHNVILVYPGNESHLKQHLVGCLNRCVIDLKIFVLDKFEDKDSTMMAILREWEDQKLLSSYKLSITGEKFYLNGNLLSTHEDYLRFEKTYKTMKDTKESRFTELENHELLKQLGSDFKEDGKDKTNNNNGKNADEKKYKRADVPAIHVVVHMYGDNEEELIIVAQNANIEENFCLLPFEIKKEGEVKKYEDLEVNCNILKIFKRWIEEDGGFAVKGYDAKQLLKQLTDDTCEGIAYKDSWIRIYCCIQKNAILFFMSIQIR